MSDNLPAAFTEGKTPMQQLLGRTLERLGGMDFVQEWAEDNPSDFMRMLLSAHPTAQPNSGGNQTLNLNLHPARAPGPLDKGVTIDAVQE